MLKDGLGPVWSVQSRFSKLVLLCELKNSTERKKPLHKEEILKTLS